ncbi:MAG: helix-turn-helix domain-containing protein [Nitrospinae bacterium]|nr:helix-turn-helix domain-containing protein [Nitrospinota bacterium]
MGKRLLRPEEAANFLSVSKWTIYRWIEEGRLKATKVGPGCLRIFSESIEELVEKNTISSIGNSMQAC